MRKAIAPARKDHPHPPAPRMQHMDRQDDRKHHPPAPRKQFWDDSTDVCDSDRKPAARRDLRKPIAPARKDECDSDRKPAARGDCRRSMAPARKHHQKDWKEHQEDSGDIFVDNIVCFIR